MGRLYRPLTLTLLLGGLTGCVQPAQQSCTPGVGSPSVVFTLYLGQAIAGRPNLTNEEWTSFLDQTITENLPNGYTVFDANGAWMNPITRRTIQEPTKVLLVALPQTPVSLAAINRIRNAYQIKFHQQLVGMTIQQACATF